MTAAVDVFRAAIAAAWSPTSIEAPGTWAPRVVRFGDAEATVSFDLVDRPWWAEPLAAVADPQVRRVSFPGSTQIGKTITLLAAMLWIAEHAPGPAMIVLPDQQSATDFRDRLYRLVQSSTARLKRVRIPPPHLWNMRHVDLGTMRVYLAWSGSKQRLRSKPCRYVFLSEVDVYASGDRLAGDPLKAAEQRTKSFWRSLIWAESSPSESPSRICSLEESATDRRRWFWPCPECGRWQEARFFVHREGEHAGRGGFVFLQNDAGEWLDADEARESARYACETGCVLDNQELKSALKRGRYLSRGQEIDADTKQVLGKRGDRLHLGFSLWAIFGPTITLGDVAAAHADARANKTLAEFCGNWLGYAYRRNVGRATWEIVGRRLAAQNERGRIPGGAWFVTAGADVQENRVVWSVRAWGEWGQSWLVDWGEFYRETDDASDLIKSDLRQLGTLLQRAYPVDGKSHFGGKTTMPIRILACDANFRTLDVHRWIASHPPTMRRGPKTRLRAVRGNNQVTTLERWKRRKITRNSRTGEVYEGGLELWEIGVNFYYGQLFDLLAGRAGRQGAWHVTADAGKIGRTYLRQVCNFAPSDSVDRHGKPIRVWGPISDKLGVDWWDTEIYQLCLADMIVGGKGWNPAAWAPGASPAKPRRKVAPLNER